MPKGNNNNLLIGLAFLKIYSDENRKSYLDIFIPLIIESIRDIETQVINLQTLQEKVRINFGINIPQVVLKAILYKAKKLDYIIRKDNNFYPNPKKIEKINFKSEQQKVEEIYLNLIKDFRKYIEAKFQSSLTDIEAEKIITSFISYNQIYFFSTSSELSETIKETSLNSKEKVFISSYIKNACENDPAAFSNIETIVKGYMLANAIYFPDPNFSSKHFKRTRFFFDTSLIIFALGYAGDELQIPCQELLNLLYRCGAQLYCFNHTVIEIKGILSACISKLDKTPDDTIFGRSIQFFASRGFKGSDINLLISTLERKIESLRIKIIDVPDYFVYKHQIDEESLFSEIAANYVSYRDDSVRRDVNSISAIYRIRKGHTSFSIEDSFALFVTNNNSLVKIANSNYYKDFDRNTIPPLITDFALTNILWLKSPIDMPNLPQQRIIADCYAAILPNEELTTKWIEEINKLKEMKEISEEDYYFLKFSEEARTSLMEITLGESRLLNKKVIPEIISKAKEKITQDIKEELEREKTDKSILESKVKELELRNFKFEEKLHLRASFIAKQISLVLKILTSVILLIPSFIFSPITTFINIKIINSLTNSQRYILMILCLLLFIVELLNLFFGTAVVSIFNSMEISLEDYIYRVQKSFTE